MRVNLNEKEDYVVITDDFVYDVIIQTSYIDELITELRKHQQQLEATRAKEFDYESSEAE